MKKPVLVITFNRPDFTQRVLAAVRQYHPERLFVFQDGARTSHPSDTEACEQVRKVIETAVDWPCELSTYYSEKNLGCGPGPAAALDWFFQQNENGIILEDDAIPHPDFFEYAATLLDKYADDPQVRAIGSMNVDRHPWGNGSYYFSMMNRNLCAWASWRRAWDDFDIRLLSTSVYKLRKSLRAYGCGVLEREYWCDRLREVHKDGVGGSSWDMQFLMSIWLNQGKGIVPNVNLASNVGTTDNATHAMGKGNIIDNVPTSPILPLSYPDSCQIQREADREFHFRYFEVSKSQWHKRKIAYFLINKRVKRLVGHQGPWRKK